MNARPSTKPPVVLVHGIWDDARTLRHLDTALRNAGLETIVVALTPNDGRVGLDALALQMRDQIDAHLPTAEPLSIVGFSMGGLVARSYLRQFGDPARLAAFISISSPHHGTWTARLRNLPGYRDMRPGSAFLAAIGADTARYPLTRWLSLRTPFDLVILPASSSILPGARNEAIPVALHPLMVWDRRIIHRVCAELAARPDPTP